MTVPYCDLAVLKDTLGITEVSNEAHLQRALEAATQWIDDHCGRSFTLSAAPETRYYYANSDGTIDVVDLVTVTSIAIDDHGDRTYSTTLASTDYELLPVNGPRYSQLRIWPTSSKSFSQGRQVRIVGTFGYVEGGQPPASVVQACQILATRLYSRKDAPFGILEATNLGQFERLSASDPDVVALLVPYVKGSSGSGSNWVMV